MRRREEEKRGGEALLAEALLVPFYGSEGKKRR